MLGHLVVASRRDHNYLTEITLTGEFKNIYVRGRADGYDPVLGQFEVVKTYKGHLNRMPDNRRQLHWAQAKIYSWLMYLERKPDSIKVALVYYNVTSKDETLLRGGI